MLLGLTLVTYGMTQYGSPHINMFDIKLPILLGATVWGIALILRSASIW